VSWADSAPTVLLLQPKRQPPAIQIETLIARSNRTALFARNNRMTARSLLPRNCFCRENVGKGYKHFAPTGQRLSASKLRIRIVIKTQHFRNARLVSLKFGEQINMSIDKNKIKTQDDLAEPAPIDQAEQRVEAEMKKLEGQARKEVAEGLKQQDEDETE
jgi:hypothetical protein